MSGPGSELVAIPGDGLGEPLVERWCELRSRSSSRARLVSSRRLGWPFGFVVSHEIVPPYPTGAATFSARSRMEISDPDPTFTGSLPS